MGTATSTRVCAALAAACMLALIGVSTASAAKRAAPVNTVSPTITGKPRVGQTLAASQGEWRNSPTSFFYQWLRCDAGGGSCAAIGGAVDPNYLVTDADLALRIRVEVVAANADGASAASRSAATAVIRIPPPTSTAKPTISGNPREGETLSATPGEWAGSPTSFAYQWKRCAGGQCVAIADATASTYPLSGADVGTRVRVRVTAANDGGERSAQSTSTPTVASATAGFELGSPKHDRKRGLVRFRVTVPAAGLLKLARTAGVRPDHRRATAPRKLKLTVKPRGQALRRVHRRGKARVKIHVTFSPDAGAPIERIRRVTLRGK